MFAFSVYDKREQIIYLARDYYGQKPLFYSNKSDLIAFSSSLLDCSNLATIRPTLNDKTALHGIQFGMSLLPETLIEDIFEVPPGHVLSAKVEQKNSIIKSIINLKPYIKKHFEAKYMEKVLAL